MEISDIIKVDIIDTNENGMGIARHDGMVVFVPNLLAGECAEVKITSIEKNYATGICVNRITSSDERIAEACPSAADCGGCTLGFMTYEAENKIKQNTVRSALRRAGLPYSVVKETVSTANRTEYRNKIVVHFDESTRSFGYRREKSNDGIRFEGCYLCSSVINEIIHYTNEHIELLYDLKPTSLNIRSSLDGITVSLYGKCSSGKLFDEYKEALKGEFSAVNDVLFFAEGGRAGEKRYIHDKIFGLDMYFTSEAFRQVNGEAFEKLLGIVHEFAAEIPFSCAADLYCGSGIIGLSLAKRFPDAKFWGIEINSDAVRDAKHNAEVNGIGNITFFSGDAATFGKRIPSSEKPELVIVDPPRAGLSKEMCADLALLSTERIIYVSCNPQTMARDAARLQSGGYVLREAVPVNMFPRTKHCECVILLEMGG